MLGAAIAAPLADMIAAAIPPQVRERGMSDLPRHLPELDLLLIALQGHPRTGTRARRRREPRHERARSRHSYRTTASLEIGCFVDLDLLVDSAGARRRIAGLRTASANS